MGIPPSRRRGDKPQKRADRPILIGLLVAYLALLSGLVSCAKEAVRFLTDPQAVEAIDHLLHHPNGE